MDPKLIRFYRTAENYRRYLVSDPERAAELGRIFRTYRRLIGRSVLDLACGGGVLAELVESSGRRYFGVDGNPDMIREARAAARARGSAAKFQLGDAARAPVRGRFATLTLLGNALGHFSPREMEELLRRRSVNVRPGSTFVVDYRDVVGMFWRGTWSRGRFVQRHKRGTIVSRTRSVDFGQGQIHIRSRPPSGRWSVEFTQAIWSPFVLETLMLAHGWRLVRRAPGRSVPGGRPKLDRWEDVYRLQL
jgi:SAM-dependent methyltransferase